MTSISEAFVQVGDQRVHYLEAGEGTPIVLLHSNGSSAREYETVMESLSRTSRVICLDCPGFGDSDPLPGRFEIESTTNVVAEFVRTKALDRPIIGGTSLGGVIALDFSHRYEDLTRGTLLIETPCRGWDAWGSIWPIVEDMFAIPTQTLEQIAPRFRAATPELLRRLNIDRNKAGSRLMMEAMWAIREFDSGVASSVSQPSLLVFGEAGVVGDGAAALMRMMPRAERIDLEDCGHFPMIDQPDELSAVLSAFLSSEAVRG